MYTAIWEESLGKKFAWTNNLWVDEYIVAPGHVVVYFAEWIILVYVLV